MKKLCFIVDLSIKNWWFIVDLPIKVVIYSGFTHQKLVIFRGKMLVYQRVPSGELT